MSDCILLTHQFIKDGEDWKYDVFDFCISHFRNNNPDTYIILTGHGKIPSQKTLDTADWFYWDVNIVEGEIDVGHPKLVTKGLEHARNRNFNYIFKSRLDSINLIENICDYCGDTLKKNHKLLLNTHYSPDRYTLMDLLNYGDVKDLIDLYKQPWGVSWFHDGTGSVARNYLQYIVGKQPEFPFNKKAWKYDVNLYNIFLSPEQIRWIDLRKNFSCLKDKATRDNLNNNNFNQCKHLCWSH